MKNLVQYKGFIYEGFNINDNFKSWFGKSVVVEDGKPLTVYHGSLKEFDEFDSSFSQVFGDLGAGFYFTSNPEEASENYANPNNSDAKGKAEDIIDEKTNEYEDAGLSFREAKAKAEQEILNLINPNVMPCYLRIEKPFYLNATIFDYNVEEDAEGNIISEGGTAIELLALMSENTYNFENYSSELYESLSYNGEIKAKDVYRWFKEYGEYSEDYSLVHLLSDMGFDGIIDHLAGSKFGTKYGKYDSTHYVVFNSNQIKSVYNPGTWSRESNKVNKE